MRPARELIKDLWESYADCEECPELACPPAKKVFGRGCYKPDILFIGMAPGEFEVVKRVPFVGPAGRMLGECLEKASEAAEFEPRSYYLNLVMCRSHAGGKNRDPKPKEIENCAPRLKKQIRIIKPKAIIRLGRLVQNEAPEIALPTFDAWHPAYVVRDRNKKPAYIKQLTYILTRIKDRIS